MYYISKIDGNHRYIRMSTRWYLTLDASSIAYIDISDSSSDFYKRFYTEKEFCDFCLSHEVLGVGSVFGAQELIVFEVNKTEIELLDYMKIHSVKQTMGWYNYILRWESKNTYVTIFDTLHLATFTDKHLLIDLPFVESLIFIDINDMKKFKPLVTKYIVMTNKNNIILD